MERREIKDGSLEDDLIELLKKHNMRFGVLVSHSMTNQLQIRSVGGTKIAWDISAEVMKVIDAALNEECMEKIRAKFAAERN